MARLYLPVGSKPNIAPKDEREELMNKLWELRYWIPGAKNLEVQQLRDYVDYAKYRVAQDDAIEAKKAQEKLATMSQEQISGAIKEFLAWKNKKLEQQGLRQKEGIFNGN
jgi:hypothetical protein